ncbi:MAG: hypothetical protein ACE37F_30940 [Nannocystaceae bacterium]|nr:hypothetical protein [bacterium]
MSNARRKTLAATVAVVMHGSMFLGGVCVPKPLDVDLDLEWELTEVELLDPDAIQGDDVNAEPLPPEPEPPKPEAPPPEPPPEPEEPPKPEEPEEPEVEEGPKRDLGQKKSRVAKLGPPSANYHVLISTRNIRKLPFGRDAINVVKPLPDFRYLVDGGGFDPLKDFDHILIASPNLRSMQHTFLVVDYKGSRESVKSKIEAAATKAGESITWEERGGSLVGDPVPKEGRDWDPRRFVLLDTKIALLIRPEFIPAVLREDVGEEKTAANYVGELTKLRRYARRIPTAGLQFVAHDLHAALKRTSTNKFELPNNVEVTIEAQPDPEFHARLDFIGASGAEGFVGFLKADVREWLAQFYLAGLFDELEIERNGRKVTVWGEFTKTQMSLILPSAASAIQKEQDRVRARQKKRRAAAEKKAAEGKGQEGSVP